MRELRRITEHAAVDFVYPLDLRDIFYENAEWISSKISAKFSRNNYNYMSANPQRAISKDMIEKLRVDVVLFPPRSISYKPWAKAICLVPFGGRPQNVKSQWSR